MRLKNHTFNIFLTVFSFHTSKMFIDLIQDPPSPISTLKIFFCIPVNVCQAGGVKLEPGVTQPPPPYSKPLKLEIQDNYVDSGK